MLIKTIVFFAFVASTIALPLEDTPAVNEEKSEVVNDAEAPPQTVPLEGFIQSSKNEDLPPPVEEPHPFIIDPIDPTPVPINPVREEAPVETPEVQTPAEEKPDLDAANTFGFGYGGWGYRPYYGYGWRRGFGYGGYGGFGYGLGFYGRAYSPWGWRGSYYY